MVLFCPFRVPRMSPALLDLQALIDDATGLEPLPASSTRLAGLLTEDDIDMEAVVECVRLDEALTARLLSAANSAMSGSRHEIDSVESAIRRLGPGMVLAFAVGSSVRGQLSGVVEEYGLSEGELWRHSVACALAIDRARTHCRQPVPTHAFPTALLHDIGKLVLARHLEARPRKEILRAQTERNLTREQAEVEILHVCHARVGGMVAEAWQLPKKIADGIRYHHRPLSARDQKARKLCHQIVLAEAVADMVGASAGSDEPHVFDASLAGSLGITRMGFEALVAEVDEALDEVLAIYSS